MEREYVTSQISLRQLCRHHSIAAHSLVTVQAKKHKWEEKREQYQAEESDAFMSRHAARNGLKPKDIAILLDRIMVLFERPTRINEGRDLNVRSELPIDALSQIVELTRGRAVPPTSPLPRTRRLND